MELGTAKCVGGNETRRGESTHDWAVAKLVSVTDGAQREPEGERQRSRGGKSGASTERPKLP